MYELYVFGGSIGERKDKTKHFSGVGTGRYYGTYNTREEARRAGKSYINSFHGGHKSYYHPKYRVVRKEWPKTHLAGEGRRPHTRPTPIDL